MDETRLTPIPKMRRVYKDTKANLDALTGLQDESLAYGTDTLILYRQNGNGAANWEPITSIPTKEIFIPVTYASEIAPSSYRPVGHLNALNEEAYMEFYVPDDFTTLVEAVIMVKAKATQAAADWDIYSMYAKVGENDSTHNESDEASTYNVTLNLVFEVDISSILTALAAGDIVGIRLKEGTAGHDVDVYGVRIKYT